MSLLPLHPALVFWDRFFPQLHHFSGFTADHSYQAGTPSPTTPSKRKFQRLLKERTTQIMAKTSALVSPATPASRYALEKGCRAPALTPKPRTSRHFPYPVFTFPDRNGSSCSENGKERPGLELFDMLVRSPKQPFVFASRIWVTLESVKKYILVL